MAAVDLKGRTIRAGLTAWSIVGIVLVAYGVFLVLGRISSALTPFFLGALIVLILRIPVNYLESRGLKRVWAVALCYLVGIGALVLLSSFAVPVIVDQLTQFFNDFPGYYDSVQTLWTDLQGQFNSLSFPAWLQTGFADVSKSIVSQFGKWGTALATGVVTAGGAAAGFLFDSLLALVVGFWALKDLPAVRTEFMDLVGEHRRSEAEMILETVLRVLGGYVRGQIAVSFVTGTLVFIGLSILKVPYAFVLGLITGVLNVIPYVGPFVGGLVSAIVGAFVGPWVALGAIGVTLAAQQLTDLFVTPRVMSEQVDLHPLLVIFSLLVGGTLFHFWGLVLAIPVAAIIKGLFVYYYEKHTHRPLGTEKGALFRKKADSEGDAGTPTAATTKSPSTQSQAEESSE